MVKTDVTSDDDYDHEVFGAFLLYYFFVEPFLAIDELFFDFMRAAICRDPSSRYHEGDMHQHSFLASKSTVGVN